MIRNCVFCGLPLDELKNEKSEFKQALLSLEESIEQSDLPVIAGASCCQCALEIEGVDMRFPESRIMCDPPTETLEVLELQLESMRDEREMIRNELGIASLDAMKEPNKDSLNRFFELANRVRGISMNITRTERHIETLQHLNERINRIYGIDYGVLPHVQCRSAGIFQDAEDEVYASPRDLPIVERNLNRLHEIISHMIGGLPLPSVMLRVARRYATIPNLRVGTVREVNDDNTITIETGFERMNAFMRVMRELRQTIRRVD